MPVSLLEDEETLKIGGLYAVQSWGTFPLDFDIHPIFERQIYFSCFAKRKAFSTGSFLPKKIKPDWYFFISQLITQENWGCVQKSNIF